MRINNRFWLSSGAVAAIALVVVGWFGFVSPQHGHTASLRDDTAAAELRGSALRHRLSQLHDQNENIAAYQAELARHREALPTTAGLSDFLRELQAAGSAAGVSVDGLIVGSPNQVTGTATTAETYSLPITLTAAGTVTALGAFLDQLQRVQPRAVLISSMAAAPAGTSVSLTGKVGLNLRLDAFVAAPSGTKKTPATPTAPATPAGAGANAPK